MQSRLLLVALLTSLLVGGGCHKASPPVPPDPLAAATLAHFQPHLQRPESAKLDKFGVSRSTRYAVATGDVLDHDSFGAVKRRRFVVIFTADDSQVVNAAIDGKTVTRVPGYDFFVVDAILAGKDVTEEQVQAAIAKEEKEAASAKRFQDAIKNARTPKVGGD